MSDLQVPVCVAGEWQESSTPGVPECVATGTDPISVVSAPLQSGFPSMTQDHFFALAEFAVLALIAGFGIKAIRRLFNV